MKSLLLLSSIFSVSLDILVKGDLEEMKEKIKVEEINGEDISRFKHDSNIFAILLSLTIILSIPLIKFMGKVGLIICVVVAVISIYYPNLSRNSYIRRRKKYE